MRSSIIPCFTIFAVLLIAIVPYVGVTLFFSIVLFSFLHSFSHNMFLQGHTATTSTSKLHPKPLSSPFSTALETLQKQLGYTFKSIGLLRRAMTHASFSQENNKAFAIFGASVIETSVAFHLLSKDVDVSSKELNRRLSQISNVDSSCAVDGTRLGLHKVVRVSPKTNSSAPAVVCAAFRAIFAAIAIDTGKSDDAGNVFWNLHGGDLGIALPL